VAAYHRSGGGKLAAASAKRFGIESCQLAAAAATACHRITRQQLSKTSLGIPALRRRRLQQRSWRKRSARQHRRRLALRKSGQPQQQALAQKPASTLAKTSIAKSH
jgi:hypothetical protein